MSVRTLSQRKLSGSRYDLDTTAVIRYAGTYSQSSVYSGASAATYANMNDGSASAATTGATATLDATNSYIRVDLGIARPVSRIIVGYDYLSNVPGGFGSPYSQALSVQISSDATTWVTVATTPTYSGGNGLITVTLTPQQCRYIQLKANTHVVATEFQVWRK